MRTLVLPSRLIRRPFLQIDCDIPATVVTGNVYQFHAVCSNATGSVTWSVETPIDGLTINASSGVINWTIPAMLGESVVLKVVDSTGAEGRRSFFTSTRLLDFNSPLAAAFLWDFNKPNTLFQDEAGTIPANVGDPVRCIKENGGRFEHRLIRRTGTGSYTGDAIVAVDSFGLKFIQLTCHTTGAVFEPASTLPQRGSGNGRTFSMAMAYRTTNAASYANTPYIPMLFNGTANTGPIVIGFKGLSGLNVCVWNRTRVVSKNNPSNDAQYLEWSSSTGNPRNFTTSSPLCMHSAIPIVTNRPRIICAWVGTDSNGNATNAHVYDGRPGSYPNVPCTWSYNTPYYSGLNDVYWPAPVTTGLVVGNSETYSNGLQIALYRVAAITGDRNYNYDAGMIYQLISDTLTTDQYGNPTIRQPIVAADATIGDTFTGPGNSNPPNQKTFDGNVGYILLRGLDWQHLTNITSSLTDMTTEVSQYAAVMSLSGTYSKSSDAAGVIMYGVSRNLLASTWNIGPTNTYTTTSKYSLKDQSNVQVVAGTVTWTDSWTPT